MKVLLINSVCGIGSTGKICGAIADAYTKEGHTVKIAYGREPFVPEAFEKYAVRIGTDLDVKLHGIRTRIFDDHGFGSKSATKKFLKWAEKFDPDLLWLHNIHGYYLHVGLLFDWIKSRPNMQVKWTLHDCWSFTGHCSHFTAAKCEKWQTGCFNCPEKKAYPTSVVFDRSRKNYLNKKKLFTGVKNLTIITPSQWLADLARQSYLKEYPVKVRHNEINKEVFKETSGDFRQKYNLEDKRIILGVANVWDWRKGFNDFIKLAETLDDKYRIVLVGVTEEQIAVLPRNVIGIKRTASATELAEIYTTADVFFNPTYEDTYPTVNLEAEACGTPVVTYNTGGCPETISLPASTVVPVGDYKQAFSVIEKLY